MLRVTGGEAQPEHLAGSRARGDRSDRGGRARPRRGGTRRRGSADGHRRADAGGARGASEAAIQNWLVATGETIVVGRAPGGGRDREGRRRVRRRDRGHRAQLLVSEGQPVAVGDPIAIIGRPGNPPTDRTMRGTRPSRRSGSRMRHRRRSPRPPPKRSRRHSPMRRSGFPVSGRAETGGPSFASPIVRRLAEERGVDLAAVKGTGPGGRIVRVDLERAAAARPAVAARRSTRERFGSALELGGSRRCERRIGRRLRRRPAHRHAPRDRSTAHREQVERAPLLHGRGLPRGRPARTAESRSTPAPACGSR